MVTAFCDQARSCWLSSAKVRLASFRPALHRARVPLHDVLELEHGSHPGLGREVVNGRLPKEPCVLVAGRLLRLLQLLLELGSPPRGHLLLLANDLVVVSRRSRHR